MSHQRSYTLGGICISTPASTLSTHAGAHGQGPWEAAAPLPPPVDGTFYTYMCPAP